MSSKYRPASLLGVGVIAGAVLSMGISAMAQRDTRGILPLDELRQFSDVFGAIKAYYVEPVEDRKLITEAISGMVTGWTRTRPTWMQMPSVSCRWARRASSAASA
jgi:carboxyl-terminal processing protease